MGSMVLILVGLSSCFGSKKTTLPLPESPRTEEPALPEDPETPEPMDTLVLQELDTLRSPVPVVDQATEPHSDAAVLEEDMTRMYKDEYALTVLLPFFANDSTSLATNRVAAWSLDFYLGFKLAFANLQPSDPHFTIQVLDTRANDAVLQRIIDKHLLEGQDVIVGPYRTSLATTVAEYVQDRPTLLVSPYSASTRLGNSNPHYLQLNPSLEAHLRTIWDFLRQNSSRSDPIVLLHGRDAGELAKQKIWSTWVDSLPALDRKRYLFVSFDETAGMELEEIQVDSLLQSDVINHLVFPSWDESMVQAMMSKVSSGLLDKQVRLFGLPQWMDFDRIAPSYFNSLNVHVSSADFLNESDPTIRRLKTSYLAAYANPLTIQAAWGFHCGEFVRESLVRDGALFHRYLDQGSKRSANRLAPKLMVIREPNGTLNRIENRNIQILKFVDGRMVPAK